jgi:hypothetical protein
MKEFRKKWAEAGYPSSFEWEHHLDVREGGSYASRFIKSLPVYIGAQVKLGLTGVGLGSKTPAGPIDAVDGTIGSLDVISLEQVDSGWVKIEVHNTMNWGSGLRIPGGDASPARIKIPGTSLTVGEVCAGIVGGVYATKQTFYWWEPMPHP